MREIFHEDSPRSGTKILSRSLPIEFVASLRSFEIDINRARLHS